MPASATGAVSIMLYVWFATFGFVMGLVTALACFHLILDAPEATEWQAGPEGSDLQETPAERISSMPYAAARWTGCPQDAAPPLPLVLHRNDVSVPVGAAGRLPGTWLYPQGRRREKSRREIEANARKTGMSNGCGESRKGIRGEVLPSAIKRFVEESK